VQKFAVPARVEVRVPPSREQFSLEKLAGIHPVSSPNPFNAISILAFLYNGSITERRPTIAAARWRLESVMSFFGSSRRSTCVGLVLSRAAIRALDIFLFFMAVARCHATTSVQSVQPARDIVN
jgi:hypothetical protein